MVNTWKFSSLIFSQRDYWVVHIYIESKHECLCLLIWQRRCINKKELLTKVRLLLWDTSKKWTHQSLAVNVANNWIQTSLSVGRIIIFCLYFGDISLPFDLCFEEYLSELFLGLSECTPRGDSRTLRSRFFLSLLSLPAFSRVLCGYLSIWWRNEILLYIFVKVKLNGFSAKLIYCKVCKDLVLK